MRDLLPEAAREGVVFVPGESFHVDSSTGRGRSHIRLNFTLSAEDELEGLDGWRTMEVIRDWGLNIKAECGGACSCATCHVYVDEAWFDRLPPPSDDEEDLLFSTLDKKPTSRLSCQILLSNELDGMKVTLAPSAAK